MEDFSGTGSPNTWVLGFTLSSPRLFRSKPEILGALAAYATGCKTITASSDQGSRCRVPRHDRVIPHRCPGFSRTSAGPIPRANRFLRRSGLARNPVQISLERTIATT
ncbi:hypothetical protein PGT21_012666 [Puccinia graminis f. sp. tritici]|uniref:Uncharacterized protein n=1 Tax=Puccinia graminis f. sp. tritici TaxID=56615 RepID=A0A5B0M3B1_PUCGR|nr:hypothetical protein PGT21_012666 [Puccinia graminis f. sp. tritici]